MELPSISSLGGKTHLIRRYAVNGDRNWSAFNPSVQIDEKGDCWMVFRSSNYVFDRDNSVIITTESKVRNRLFIGRLNLSTMELDESTIKELDMTRLNPQMERGIEDARLYFDGKRWCLSATHLEIEAPRARIGVLRLKSLSKLGIHDFSVLEGPDPDRPEKNWMPIHKIGHASGCQVDFLYNCQTIVSGENIQKVSDNPQTASFRGGSQLIPLDDGTFLAVIHDIYFTGRKGFNSSTFTNVQRLRNYCHRFVRFDGEFNPVQVSEPFTFIGKQIEFAAGLAEHNDNFIISFGSQDIASYVATISKDKLLRTLKDL